MDHRTPASPSGPIGLLRRFVESAGGFTLHHRTGEPARAGVSVCATPEASLSFPLSAWDDAEVAAWFHTWAARIRGSDLHLGGWLDPVTQWVSLDVVRVYPPHRRHDAVHQGRALHQKAVFDLGQGQALAVAGTP